MNTITCDNCGHDITDAGAYPAFNITVHCTSRPTSGGVVYAVAVYPPIPRGRHDFCGKKCLVDWLSQDHDD